MTLILTLIILHYALKPTPPLSRLIFICVLSVCFSFAMGLTLSRGVLLIIITAILGLLLYAWRQKLFFKHSLVLLSAIILGYFLSSLLLDENIANRLGSMSTKTRGLTLFYSICFMYKEDIDLSLRIKKIGYKMMVHRTLIAYHCRGGIKVVNKCLFCLKNYQPLMICALV